VIYPLSICTPRVTWRICARFIIHYPYLIYFFSSAFQQEWRTLQKTRKRVQAELHHAEQVLETRSEQLRHAKAVIKTDVMSKDEHRLIDGVLVRLKQKERERECQEYYNVKLAGLEQVVKSFKQKVAQLRQVYIT